MNELMTHERLGGSFRRHLLVNVSTLALLGYAWMTSGALASSADEARPTVWIQLGGQLERSDNPQSIFAPQYFDLASPSDVNVMTDAQRPSRYAIGGEGKISFEPAGTNWIFSAGVRYGRANSARHLHHETAGLPEQIFTTNGHLFLNYFPRAREFGDGQSAQKDTHLIVDFKAGKDIGLGLFGSGSSSVFSAGVRFAQFTSRSDLSLHARPLNQPSEKYSPGKYQVYLQHHRTYTAVLHTERDTHAVGPAVSWDASIPIMGAEDGAELRLDWGVNAAILFGRQRAKVQHQTEGIYRTGLTAGTVASSYSHNNPARLRSKTVTIPNLGGFAGISLKFTNAKISLGYRGDLFFGATDRGIDAERSSDQKFYGPFAAISIGLGG